MQLLAEIRLRRVNTHLYLVLNHPTCQMQLAISQNHRVIDQQSLLKAYRAYQGLFPELPSEEAFIYGIVPTKLEKWLAECERMAKAKQAVAA